jgi:tetratricopeptide (TPR) repeat protein
MPVEPNDGQPEAAAPARAHAMQESIAAAARGAAEPADAAVDGAAQQLQDALEQARQLYWKRDMRAAANAYQSLGQANPENPDVWGEIGNFYYSLRQRQPAVEAYSRALTLLVGQNDQTRAQQMLDVLYKLDAGKARELEQGLLQPGH